MKRKGLIVTTCAVLLGISVIGAGAYAGGKYGHRMMGPGGPEHGRIFRAILDTKLDIVAEKLQLSESQRSQVDQIRDRVWADFQAGREDRGEMRDRFLEEFKKDSLRAETLDELVAQKEARHDAMKQSVKQAILDVHALLTPEQRGQLAILVAEHCDARGME